MMELELDQLFSRAVVALKEKADAGKLEARLEHVAQLARARMQIQEFHQREVLAMRKSQERLAEVLLKYYRANLIPRNVMMQISDDLDRVFASEQEDAGVEIESSTAAVLISSKLNEARLPAVPSVEPSTSRTNGQD